MSKPKTIEELLQIVYDFGNDNKDNPIVFIVSDGTEVVHSISGKTKDLFNAVYSSAQCTQDEHNFSVIASAIETSKKDKGANEQGN